MDCEAFKRELVTHYAELSTVSTDWAKQARHSCEALAKTHPVLFNDLPALVREKLVQAGHLEGTQGE